MPQSASRSNELARRLRELCSMADPDHEGLLNINWQPGLLYLPPKPAPRCSWCGRLGHEGATCPGCGGPR